MFGKKPSPEARIGITIDADAPIARARGVLKSPTPDSDNTLLAKRVKKLPFLRRLFGVGKKRNHDAQRYMSDVRARSQP